MDRVRVAGVDPKHKAVGLIRMGRIDVHLRPLTFDSEYEGQPSSTSLYGNKVYAAALAFYRDDILSVIEEASCSDGLDDDGDGFTDHPDDPDCRYPGDRSEYTYVPTPTLGHLGSGLLVGVLLGFGARAQYRRIATATR